MMTALAAAPYEYSFSRSDSERFKFSFVILAVDSTAFNYAAYRIEYRLLDEGGGTVLDLSTATTGVTVDAPTVTVDAGEAIDAGDYMHFCRVIEIATGAETSLFAGAVTIGVGGFGSTTAARGTGGSGSGTPRFKLVGRPSFKMNVMPFARSSPADLWFPTRTLAQAAFVSASVSIITTGGYAAFPDNGAARYLRVGSAPSHPGYITTNSGTVYWELDKTQTITPEMFNAVGNGAADDTAALGNMFTTLNAFGHGWQCKFKNAAVYRIWPGITAYTELVNFFDKNDWLLDFNGAKILTAYTAGGFPTGLIQVYGCKRWTIRRFNVEHITPAAAVSTGNNGLTIQPSATNGSTDFLVDGYLQIGGSRGVHTVRPLDVSYARVERYRVLNGYCEDVYYPCGCQNDGDNGYWEMDGKRGGRTFIAYGVRRVKAVIVSVPGNYVEDLVLEAAGAYAGSGLIAATEDIDIHYTATQSFSAGGAVVSLLCSSFSPANAPAVMRNVRIHFNAVTAYQWNYLLNTSAFKRDAGNNIVTGDAAGYEMSNIVLTGNLYGDLGFSFADIGLASKGFSSNTTVDITFEDIQAAGNTKGIAQGLYSNLTCRNVQMTAAAGITNPDGAPAIGRLNVFGSFLGTGYGAGFGPVSSIGAMQWVATGGGPAVNGAFWFDGTNFKCRIGGVVKTFTVT